MDMDHIAMEGEQVNTRTCVGHGARESKSEQKHKSQREGTLSGYFTLPRFHTLEWLNPPRQ